MWAMRIDDAAFTIQFFWRQFKGLGEATSGAPAPAPIIMLPACCGSDSSESSPELVIADGSADEFVSFPAGGTEASGNDLDDDGCMDCGMSWFVRFVPGSGNASVHCVADVGHIERTASDIIVPFGEDEATARASATAMSTHRPTHHRRRSLPSLRLRRLTFPATFRSSAAQKCRTRRPEHRFALVWSRTHRSLDYRSSQWLTRQPGLRSDCRLSPAAVRPVRPSSPTHH